MRLLDYPHIEHGCKLLPNHLFFVLGETIGVGVYHHLWVHLNVVFDEISTKIPPASWQPVSFQTVRGGLHKRLWWIEPPFYLWSYLLPLRNDCRQNHRHSHSPQFKEIELVNLPHPASIRLSYLIVDVPDWLCDLERPLPLAERFAARCQ